MQVEIGKIYEGTVKNITKYGAFVELQMPEEEKVMGMVHISEISRSYVNEIRDFVTEGQSVRVKVIGTNPQGKISLSMKQAEENKALLEKMKTILGERVKDVRVSTTLKNHPVCITTDGAISMEMEKVLNSMPGAEQKVKAEQIFELNTEHPVFEVLRRFENDEDKLKKYTEVLYDQALLIEGRSIEDPVAYANNVAELLAQ